MPESTPMAADEEHGDAPDRITMSLAIARAAEALWNSGRLDPLLDEDEDEESGEAAVLADLLFTARPEGWLS